MLNQTQLVLQNTVIIIIIPVMINACFFSGHDNTIIVTNITVGIGMPPPPLPNYYYHSVGRLYK